jgi:hypothetical protein
MKKVKGTTQKAESINIERKLWGGSLVPIFHYLSKNAARVGLISSFRVKFNVLTSRKCARAGLDTPKGDVDG